MVVFTSDRDLHRAENLKSVYDAYDGEKIYANLWFGVKGDIQVTDELPFNRIADKCIFIGHGMGAGKTYGLDQPDPYFRRERSNLLTYCIASSEEMVPIVAKQCGVKTEQVIPLGMPRTDLYFGHRKYKKPGRTYLYAPTYRDDFWQPDWNTISAALPEGDRLIVKTHMLTGRMLYREYPNITEASSQDPTTPFLLDCDVLITDYSSLMFDAMVIRTPVVLFAKDKNNYLGRRGMYFPYPDNYSEWFTDDEKKLIDLCGSAQWTERDEELRTFYAGACDGHSVERVLELIRRLEK